VRIRTRTGHQILLHNSEDLIYIGNARGTAWVELTSNGKIDIWAADSISIKSEADVNITATRDINLHARNGEINMFAGKSIYQTAQESWEVQANADTKITALGNSNISAQGQHIETAGQIHMNGPAASSAAPAKVPSRVPAVEPWLDHENLNPKEHTPDKTQARSSGAPPAAKGVLKRIIDTFKKIGK
jgi:hypothetical protein